MNLGIIKCVLSLILWGAYCNFISASDSEYYEGRFFSITYINDNNPLIGQLSNDMGYTYGMNLQFQSRYKNRNYYRVTLTSDLYTHYLNWDQYFFEDDRKIKPQKFTEISTLEFSHYIRQAHSLDHYCLSGGMGILNRDEPIFGLALYQQGGQNGRGGYHAWIDNLPWANNHGQENLSTGGLQPFIYIYPSLTKYLLSNSRSFLSVSPGIRIATLRNFSKAAMNIHYNLTVAKLKAYSSGIKLQLLANINSAYFVKDGQFLNPNFGVQSVYQRIIFKYMISSSLGNQPTSIYSYVDSESIMKLTIAYTLK